VSLVFRQNLLCLHIINVLFNEKAQRHRHTRPEHQPVEIKQSSQPEPEQGALPEHEQFRGEEAGQKKREPDTAVPAESVEPLLQQEAQHKQRHKTE
jgi:hypothetical protein